MRSLQSLILLFVLVGTMALTSCSSSSDDDGPVGPTPAQLLLENLTTVAAGEGWVIQSFTAQGIETWREAGQPRTAVQDFNYTQGVVFDTLACGPDNVGDYMVFNPTSTELLIRSGRDQNCNSDAVVADQVLETAIYEIGVIEGTDQMALAIREFFPFESPFFNTPLDPNGRYGDFATACFNPASQPYLFILQTANPSATTLEFEFTISCALQNITFNSPGTFDVTARLVLAKGSIL